MANKRCSECGERPCECLRMDVGHAIVYFTDPEKAINRTTVAKLPLALTSKGHDILWLERLYKLEDKRTT